MNQEQLDIIRKRLDAVSDLEWTYDDPLIDWPENMERLGVWRVEDENEKVIADIPLTETNVAEFIIHAREDIADLLALIDPPVVPLRRTRTQMHGTGDNERR
jgi:hypothetical protein